jgi:hypothetical protein
MRAWANGSGSLTFNFGTNSSPKRKARRRSPGLHPFLADEKGDILALSKTLCRPAVFQNSYKLTANTTALGVKVGNVPYRRPSAL